MPPSSNDRQVVVFDTTLRDGEQSPGASLSLPEKLQIAHALSELRVDVIEAGFPISSPGDEEAVGKIAREVRGPTICALARANPKDIETAARSLENAQKPRLHTFLATSDIHLEHKLRISREQCLQRTLDMVSLAKQYADEVEFSAEDAARSDESFLVEVLSTAIAAGATTVNVPDTVGFMTPGEFAGLIGRLRREVRNVDSVVLSVHCHDDLGLSVANSLAAVQAGARQVECTINGLGERAGNCSLEELVMVLRKRGEALGELHTGIDTTKLIPTSRLVSRLTGFSVQRNKAIVGDNAFAHESGIHQDGVLKNKLTYEIIDPAEVGLTGSHLPLGPRSGKHALKTRLQELGYQLPDDQLAQAYRDFKALADKKKTVTDLDLVSLLEQERQIATTENFYQLEGLQFACGSGLPTASVEIRDNLRAATYRHASLGTGPVDAVYKAIREVVGLAVELLEYSVKSVTEGIDAQGEVGIRISYEGSIYRGYGSDTDILVASARAYLNALNKLQAELQLRQRYQASEA